MKSYQKGRTWGRELKGERGFGNRKAQRGGSSCCGWLDMANYSHKERRNEGTWLWMINAQYAESMMKLHSMHSETVPGLNPFGKD